MRSRQQAAPLRVSSPCSSLLSPRPLQRASTPPLTTCKASSAPPTAKELSIIGIPPSVRSTGGLDPHSQPDAARDGYASSLRNGFLPINLLHPGLRIMNVDPPVLTIDNFVPLATCDALIEAAKKSDSMQQSQVGGLGSLGGDIRTSRSLPFTRQVLEQFPDLKDPLATVLAAATQLVQLEVLGVQSGAFQKSLFTKPSSPGMIVPELPQIAHYQPGQHFLAHEDAFPSSIALEKGYQRRATLLVYLNDVKEGGATHFNHLGFEVQPTKGSALLFFPAFSGGTPDARTLHTAVDAVEEKWIFQLWLTSGLPKRSAAAINVPFGSRAGNGGTTPKAKKKRK